jgi:hypothetical protein
MKFARYVFAIAGVYGLLVLLPQYFLIEKNGAELPPAITHPEYYYGFVGVALAFQIVFLIIATNPAKYRTMMLAAVVEKLAFFVPVMLLASQGRVGQSIFFAAILDGILGVLFIVSYIKTSDRQ